MWHKYTFLPIFCCLILSLAWYSLREGDSLGRDPSGVLVSAHGVAHNAMLRHSSPYSLSGHLPGSFSKYSKANREGSQDIIKGLRGTSDLREDVRLELLETLNRISQEIEGMKFALEHSAQKQTMGSSSVKSLEIEELKEFEKEGQ